MTPISAFLDPLPDVSLDPLSTITWHFLKKMWFYAVISLMIDEIYFFVFVFLVGKGVTLHRGQSPPPQVKNTVEPRLSVFLDNPWSPTCFS